jgi:hypothetical protein
LLLLRGWRIVVGLVKKLEGGGLLLWRLSLLRRPREALLGLLKLR